MTSDDDYCLAESLHWPVAFSVTLDVHPVEILLHARAQSLGA